MSLDVILWLPKTRDGSCDGCYRVVYGGLVGYADITLVKPFLFVCTYIIDVWGPYPSTISDAEIINKEFTNASVLRQYFESGDAFILDRGFRDALPLLNECGYRTYVPSSLQQGESQLSTLEANKSRIVTICRWVVEVVNGRFKRDFKIFRQHFFN